MFLLKALFLLVVILSSGIPGLASIPDVADHPSKNPIRRRSKTIYIAFSRSLYTSSPAVTPGSDLVGAIRRALRQWSMVSGVRFVEVSSKLLSVSPPNHGDGINLITIASTARNSELLERADRPARTRVFYDQNSGEITEADVAFNPSPYSPDGRLIQFSTDETYGTYDIESIALHELGHVLGLEHSALMSSTMQPHQAPIGVYGLVSHKRALSESDINAARSLYGFARGLGEIEGRIFISSFTTELLPLVGAHIWVEEAASGRIIASSITDSRGSFKIRGLSLGEYRVLAEPVLGSLMTYQSMFVEWPIPERLIDRFRSVEIIGHLTVTGTVTAIDYVLVPPNNLPPNVSPSLIGTNGELSMVPLLVEPGRRLRVLIAGEGLDGVPASGISVSSPFFTIDATSLSQEYVNGTVTVISFDISVAPDTPPGDYSIRLQAYSGETAYVAGGLTVQAQVIN